jgi:hypothetical protein
MKNEVISPIIVIFVISLTIKATKSEEVTEGSRCSNPARNNGHEGRVDEGSMESGYIDESLNALDQVLGHLKTKSSIK